MHTFASFALVAGTPDPAQRDAQLKNLDSADCCGHPGLRWPLWRSLRQLEQAERDVASET